MTLAEQLEKMGVHVEVKCASHRNPENSHTLTKDCDKDATVEWIRISDIHPDDPEFEANA